MLLVLAVCDHCATVLHLVRVHESSRGSPVDLQWISGGSRRICQPQCTSSPMHACTSFVGGERRWRVRTPFVRRVVCMLSRLCDPHARLYIPHWLMCASHGVLPEACAFASHGGQTVRVRATTCCHKIRGKRVRVAELRIARLRRGRQPCKSQRGVEMGVVVGERGRRCAMDWNLHQTTPSSPTHSCSATRRLLLMF